MHSTLFPYSIRKMLGALIPLVSILIDSRAAADVITSFSLDTDPGWSKTGGWVFGAPLGANGAPHNADTGQFVYHHYRNYVAEDGPIINEATLRTTAIDCSGYEGVRLRFSLWLTMVGSPFDHLASIQVSNNPNGNWVTIWEYDGFDPSTSTSWERKEIDISAVADGEPTVYIRWIMGPTYTEYGSFLPGYAGMNIDDITIEGIPVRTDREIITEFPLDSDPGWSTQGQWSFGEPQGRDGDPTQAHSGQNVYGYNLAGAYETPMPEQALTTAAIDCRGYEHVILRYKRWLTIEGRQTAGARVEVSNDATNWVSVWSHTGNGRARYEYFAAKWTDEEIDISAVADGQPTVFIRWTMGPIEFPFWTFYGNGGWNIDDVSLEGVSDSGHEVLPRRVDQKTYYIGQSLSLIQYPYTLTNASPNDWNWDAVSSVTWLDISPSSGTLAPGESIGVTVTANSSIETLTPGLHTARINFGIEPDDVGRIRPIDLLVHPTAPLPFAENFEGGATLRNVWRFTSAGAGRARTRVTALHGPHAGSAHLTMDSTSFNAGSRNELTLAIDARGYKDILIGYWARDYNDASTGPPPIPFTGGSDFDGIAISVDFHTWYEIADLRSITSTYAPYQISLDDAIAALGIPESPVYGIRFNQWDTNAIPLRGIALDDISITGTPVGSDGPDLAIFNVQVPTTASVGNYIEVTWDTENIGLSPADGLWKDCVYLSADDQVGDDVQLGCVDRPAPVPVGAVQPGSATVSIPDVPDGDYWLIVHLDQNDDIPEADDANNFAVVGPIAITRPNLVPENLAVQSTVAIGERVPISWEVLNAGTGAAFSLSEDCLYLSADDQVGGDLPIGCLTDFDRDLDPGERQNLSGNFVIPETPDGTYWIILRVDSSQDVLGDDPSDNTLVVGPVTVTRPDLQLQEITIPAEAAPREFIDIGWTVQNLGAGKAQAAWGDQVFLSSDDLAGGDVYMGTVYQWDSVPAGETYTQNADIRIPDVPDGVYHVVVVADYYHYLSDPNRADNTRIVGTITLSRPDLGISLISVPSQADSGSAIPMEWQVDNHGDFRTRHTWSDCVYLSADEAVGNDTPVACVSRLQDVGVGESYTQVAQVQLPQVPEGHYWLYVAADGNEDVPELNEADNVSGFLPIIVATPNIAPTALMGPSVASPLQKVNVSWTIGNNTIAAALGSWRDGVYLSNDNAAGNDTFIANFPRPSAIAPGESYDQTHQVTLPDVADGQYWLVVKADDNNNLLETNESDNTFVFGPLSITRPDLQLAIESVEPQSPRSEGTLTVAWRVANGSSSPTGHNWQDCIYLSSDAAIGNDTLLKCVDRSANLAGSEAYDLQATLTLPVLAEGQYWIVVKTDAHGTVPESNDANNVQIAGPIDVRLVLPPVIAPVADDTATPGAPYTGPVPVLTQGTEPVTWSLVGGPPGMTIDETTGVVSWATAEETFEPYTVTIRATNEAGNATASWKLGAPLTYTATVSTPVTLVPGGTPIPLEGMATITGTGDPAPNKPVTIRIWVQDTRRLIEVITGDDGAFATTFNPLPREGGRYTIGADHPLVPHDKADDEFFIVSMGLTPETLTRRLTPGVESTDPLVLKNHGDEALNGITYEVQGAPIGLAVSLTTLPATLGPRAEVPLTLSLLGQPGTNRLNELTVRVLSGEGAVATLALSAEVVPITPELVATPGTLKTGMLRGAQTFSETILTNIGGVETGALEVLLPEADWLSLVTPKILPSLEPGESAGVTLSLTPEATLDLGPYNGYYRVKGAQTNLTVPFTFTALSDARGDLKITVVDEFTYFAEGTPKVAGAELTLSDPNTGDPIPYLDPESGEPVAPVTGPDGSFTFHSLPEAYYEVAIKAPGHEFHRGTYLVPAGGVEDVEIFLSRQMVSYTWNVVPTEIEDRYDITIDLTFETHVPAPVVTVDPPFIDLIDMTEPVKQIDMTITNHGLIAAEGLNIHFPADPRITVLPLVEDIGLLPAQSSYIVPVIVYDNQYLTKNATPDLLNRMTADQKAQLDPQATAKSQKDIGFCGYYSGWITHYYKCGPRNIQHGANIPVRWPWAWCVGGGGPWTPPHCVDCDSGPGGIRRPSVFVSNPVKCDIDCPPGNPNCNDDCRNRGTKCEGGDITAGNVLINDQPADQPVAVDVAQKIEFKIVGGSVAPATRTFNCDPPVTLPGGTPTYTWVIKQDGVEKDKGTGATASITPDLPGIITCTFTAKPVQECDQEQQQEEATAYSVRANFKEHDQQRYGFDDFTNLDKKSGLETKDGHFKSIKTEGSDTVTVKITPTEAKNLVFFQSSDESVVTTDGVLNKDGILTLTAGDKDMGKAEIQVSTDPDFGSECGKLNVRTYDEKVVKLGKIEILEDPLFDDPPSNVAIGEYLKTIYKQAIVSFQVSNLGTVSAPDFDRSFTVGDDTFTYSDDMERLVDAARTVTGGVDKVVVFLQQEAQGTKQVLGNWKMNTFCAQGKKYGVVFMAHQKPDEILNTLAHELGHGIGGLLHIDTLNACGPLGDLNNLMVPVGTKSKLREAQWDILQNADFPAN